MEERNILWGELVGGLLIVGCSVALVITLWQTLEQIHYFPFLIFSSITLALFGAGHYTLHHWKLEATSRGLLVIATLLIPLNLLVLAGLSRGRGGGLAETATTAAGLALSVAVVASAGRVLAARARWLLVLGVVGAAATQLLVPRLPAPPSAWLLALPACLAVSCQAAAIGWRLRLLRGAGVQPAWEKRQVGNLPHEALDEGEVYSLLLFLGLCLFALAVPLGFLLSRAADMRRALQYLAFPLAVSGVPVLSAGLLLQRRLGEERPLLGGLRTVSTAIVLAGMLVLLGAVTLAWPDPGVLLAVCAADAAVLTYLAFRQNMPLAHAAALPCLVLGYLTAFHLAVGNLVLSREGGVSLAAELFSGASGAALAMLVVLLSGMAELLLRRGLREHAVAQALGSAAVAGLSLWLVNTDGSSGPGRAALVCGLYAVVGLLANVRWQRLSLSYAGQGLLLAATLWALQAGWPGRPPLWGAVLAVEALGLAALAAWRGHRGQVDGQGPPV